MDTIKGNMQKKLEIMNKHNNLNASTIYECVVEVVKEEMEKRPLIKQDKKLYYISAEFLLGKMLSSNLINLGIYDEIEEIVTSVGFTMDDIVAVELEPSLGNGGLGRLAACFLDSIASLQLCGDGIGLYYHFGLFEQKFKDYKQVEVPNSWISKTSWFTKKKTEFTVPFPEFTLHPVVYDMDVIGYEKGKNTLHLFDIESIDESLVKQGIDFDKTNIEKNLTLFLYPDDSDDEGRLLRIYQQYFMVSCAAQMILADCKAKGYDLRALDEHVVIQINDTHPSLVIAELIRLLQKEGMLLKDALAVVEKTCAYTNHTILAEALETWPMAYLEKVVPDLLEIIISLDAIAHERGSDEKLAIIDAEHRVHMAHMDIHFGKSVNGVAALHSDILKNTELHEFYKLYPEKFNNKTNGITFRRWLYSSNPQLTSLLVETLGKEVFDDANVLSKLKAYENDNIVLQKLLDIKEYKKQAFIKHMKKKQNITLLEHAIFDTQVKRLHEYKRQQMNALYIIHKYLDIKRGNLPKRPLVCIFGAKAAPAYTIAKDIIHILLCLEEIIAKDKAVAPYLQLCFIENYNVSEAEIVVPATDISEQISLASKEASGTGNMKFMLNGALTLGTRDGANVEIADLVKEENIYIFGKSSEEVIQHYERGDYCAKTLYEEREHIQELVDFIVGKEMMKIGDEVSLKRFYHELLNKDWFMTLLDLEEYIECKERMIADYEDRMLWAKKMLHNIAGSAFFSSDRTIMEYEEDIWKLRKGEKL
ncbi:glycogen/starch/alpha-glucan phosphorylase [Amedibacillus sp. YH-ame6]